jgi:DNA-binding SARP family transcriptional activator/DNA-binding HxlR family transcriptional regulator
LDAVSEQWSPLIIQDALFHGTTQFSTFQLNLKIAPDVLSTRLSGFVDAGVMEILRNVEHPNHQEYVLTEKGRDLAPMMIALSHWGDRWLDHEEESVVLEHDDCGGIIEQLIRCDRCGEDPLLDDVHPHSQSDAEVLVAALDTASIPISQSHVLSPSSVRISVLGAFAVEIDGSTVRPLSAGTQRILAYLAIHEYPVTRLAMAGTMWPDVTERHAGGSLRSALSRLDHPTRESILMASAGLRLDDHVVVDFRESRALAQRLLRAGASPAEADLSAGSVAALSRDLLPDWYDDWVVAEAENWRYLRRNGLEALAGLLMERKQWAVAAESARAAIAVDPLRETPQACLIRIHLATGNQSEALEAYDQYQRRLMEELGIEPTALLSDLVSSIRSP